MPYLTVDPKSSTGFSISNGNSSSNKSFLASGLLSSAGGIIGNLISNIFNYKATQATNQANKDINQANIDYNTAMTREQWERDDTAHQREVADLEAAGLSPLANTTGSQVTSALSAPNPIAMQAPQIDTNSLVNSIIQAEQLKETERHNRVNEGHSQEDLRIKGQEVKNIAYQLQIQNKKVEADIKYQADLINAEMDKLAEVIEHDKNEEELRQLEFESNEYYKEIEEQGGKGYPYLDCYDLDIYEVEMKLYATQLNNFAKKIGATQTAHGEQKSTNANGGLSAGMTVAPGSPGVTAGANGGYGESNSKYDMENLSEQQKAEYEAWKHAHPKPIYHRRRWRTKNSAHR